MGISNEPRNVISDFIEDQGITFPVLVDYSGIYGKYNLPGADSPYPRDFIIDADGIIRLAKHEYEPGVMITVIESLLRDPTGVIESNPTQSPHSPVLLSTYPNPFNPDARINLLLSEERRVSLRILDIRGRVVEELMYDEPLDAGQYQLGIEGEALKSGIYFLQLITDQERLIQKIVKLK